MADLRKRLIVISLTFLLGISIWGIASPYIPKELPRLSIPHTSAATALVQRNGCIASSVTSKNCGFNSSVTAGNLIVLAISTNNSVASFTLQDTFGQNFVKGCLITNTGTSAVYYSFAANSGSENITASGFSSTLVLMNIFEYSMTQAFQSVQCGTATGTGTAVNIGQGMVSNSGGPIHVAAIYANNPSSYTQSGSYTLRTTSTIGAAQDEIVQSTDACPMTLGSSKIWAEACLEIGVSMSTSVQNTAAGSSVNKAINYVSLNQLITVAVGSNVSQPSPTVSDTFSDTFHLINQTTNTAWAAIYYALSTSTGTDTVTVSGSTALWGLQVRASAGYTNASITSRTNTGTGTSYSTASITPSIQSLLIAVVSAAGSQGTQSSGSGLALAGGTGADALVESVQAISNASTFNAHGTTSQTWAEVGAVIPDVVQVTETATQGGSATAISGSNLFSLSGKLQSGTVTPFNIVGSKSIFRVDPSSTVTIGATTNGSTTTHQWAITFSGSSATTTTFNSGAATTLANSQTYYEQYKPTVQLTANLHSTFDSSSMTLIPTGTQLGAGFNLPTITTSNGVATATENTGWVDTGSKITFPSTLSSAPANERWATFTTAGTLATNQSATITTANTINENYYEQVTNTWKITAIGQNFGSGLSLSVTGNFLTVSSSNIATETINNGDSTDSASGYSDYNSGVTFPISITGAATNTRWQNFNNAANTTSALTSGGTTYTQKYQSQVNEQFAYSLVDGGSPTAPTLTTTYFGASNTTTLTTSLIFHYLDYNKAWNMTNPLGTSTSNEQWVASSGASGTSSAGASQTTTYYHQFSQTLSYSLSGTTVTSGPPAVGYVNGTYTVLTLTTSGVSKWWDAQTIKFGIPVCNLCQQNEWTTTPSTISGTSQVTQVVAEAYIGQIITNCATLGYPSQFQLDYSMPVQLTNYGTFVKPSGLICSQNYFITGTYVDFSGAITNSLASPIQTFGIAGQNVNITILPLDSGDVPIQTTNNPTTTPYYYFYNSSDVSILFTPQGGSSTQVSSYLNLGDFSICTAPCATYNSALGYVELKGQPNIQQNILFYQGNSPPPTTTTSNNGGGGGGGNPITSTATGSSTSTVTQVITLQGPGTPTNSSSSGSNYGVLAAGIIIFTVLIIASFFLFRHQPKKKKGFEELNFLKKE